MKSSDLVLFKNICNKINPDLYVNLQSPNSEFIEEIEKNYFFEELELKYSFEELEKILGVNLRYYQKLAIYFAKYYLEYEYQENNKLAYWMATGSGKTLIMKANIIDYLEYLRDKNPSQIEIIITSPMSELINQLNREMKEFFNHEFFNEFNINYKIDTTQSLINLYKKESPEIVGDNFYRLLLVDEAHIGLQTKKDKSAFVKLRNDLTQNVENSFMFEYSATFYDIKGKDIEEYANRIVFEYDYSKFFNDKYGKDFKFDIVQKDEIANDNEEIKINLDKNIEAFSKKINAFFEYNKKYPQKPFSDKPLLVMAGNTVAKSSEEENSDIAKVVNYFANLQKRDKNIFYTDEKDAILHLFENSEADGEIILSYGENSTPFGLITIGDVRKFLDNPIIQTLIQNQKLIYKKMKFIEEEYLFENIDKKKSPINILIGSKKFSAGWNSFRVSQICLINFGTSSGPTIIQMFGRGVRLKGFNNDGKRSVFEYVISDNNIKSQFKKWDRNIEIDREKYELLKYLETLFVFSLRKTYLEKFIEKSTSILYKVKTIEKKTKINKIVEDKEFPIFYLEKEKYQIDNLLVEIIKSENLIIKHENKKYELNKFKISLNVENAKKLNISDIEYLKEYIDLSYINYIINRDKHVKIKNFNIDFIIELIKNDFITIYYDNKIETPIQFQKLIIRVANELKKKIQNKIIHEEAKDKYKLTTIKKDDLIDKYEIRVTFEREAKQIAKALKSIEADSFIEFLYHYFIPLSVDLKDKVKEETINYFKLLEKDITINYNSIYDYINEKLDNEIQNIRITPDKLNGYEIKFLKDLEEYITEKELDIVVLRNKSKNNIGISLENGIFYPDFILWYQKDDITHIIFCDPKGISRPEVSDKVLNTPYEIKKFEELFKNDIQLHYFTISNTKKNDVAWSPIKDLSLDECDIFYNLVFMEDDKYIERVFKGIDFDITLHKAFVEYIQLFDKETRKEWIDESKREYHIKIIKEIQKEENLTFDKALLLYFVIYEKQDIIEKKLANDIKQDITQNFLEELLSEIGASVLADVLPMGNTVFKTIKLLKKWSKKLKNVK